MFVKAEAVMTKELISIEETASMMEAYERMRDEGIRHLLVKAASGKIAGILSDRDVQRAMSPDIQDAGVFRGVKLAFDPAFQVKDFMSSPVRQIASDASIREVAQAMLGAKVSSLLVTAPSGKPIGFVTTDDLLGYLTMEGETPTGMLGIPVSSLLARRAQELGYLS